MRSARYRFPAHDVFTQMPSVRSSWVVTIACSPHKPLLAPFRALPGRLFFLYKCTGVASSLLSLCAPAKPSLRSLHATYNVPVLLTPGRVPSPIASQFATITSPVVSGFDYNTLVSVSGDVDFDHTRNNLQVYVPLTLLSTVSFLSYCLSFSLVDRGYSTGGDV